MNSSPDEAASTNPENRIRVYEDDTRQNVVVDILVYEVIANDDEPQTIFV